MALTAARTELNVSLVGEDETIRMLEDAKKRMAELESKTRSLTGATKAQTEAAKAQQSALEATNGKLMGMAKKAEGVVEGVDKVKGAFEKVVGVAGFLGMAVSGAIDAFNFLRNAFDDSEEKAAELEKQMARNKAETEKLRSATDALTSSLNRMKAATGQSAAVLAAERATLAELRGDMVTAAFEKAGVAIEQQKLKLNELRAEEKKRDQERAAAVQEVIDSQAREQALVAKQDRLRREAVIAENEARRSFDKTEGREKALRLRAEADAQGVVLAVERARGRLALQARDAIDEANTGLREQLDINKQILDQQLINLGKPEQAEVAPRGGGGGGRRAVEDVGPTPEELAEQARKRREFYHEFRLEELEEEKKHQRRMALAGLGEDNLSALRTTRDAVAAELASLPQGAMAAAFAPLRTELEKRLTELDGLAKQHAQMGIAEYFDQEQADKVLSAWEAEQKAIEQVNAALSALGETRIKAAEESARLAEQLERENLAGYVDNFKGALEALSEVQTPAFEAISASLAGVSAQMGKFKDGQQSLTAAIVGSAGAIAGAVADKVASVRVEAGIRALFETAMGFATLGNPAESVGHFTAAAMFGLVAGGVIPTAAKAGTGGGGQKAPKKEAMSTREGALSGGGGQVTNVYNLNTGIVDGQSTAQAFRRAEMQARNTGMASAGGW